MVLDTGTGFVVGTRTTGSSPTPWPWGDRDTTALVASSGGHRHPVISPRSGRDAYRGGIGARRRGRGGPGDSTALVANLGDGTVTPVDLTTLRAGRPIPVGSEPDAVAVGGPGDSTALVANLGDGTVTPVDLHPRSGWDVSSPWSGSTGCTVVWGIDGVGLVGLVPDLIDIAISRPARDRRGHVAQRLPSGSHGTTAGVAGIDGTVTPVDLRTGRGAACRPRRRPTLRPPRPVGAGLRRAPSNRRNATTAIARSSSGEAASSKQRRSDGAGMPRQPW